MNVPRKHFPAIGLLSLVLVGVAAGSIYYYQFVAPRCGLNPTHRMIFMTAIIQEIDGFRITNTGFLKQSVLPQFDPSSGANLTGVQYQNYQGASDNKTIEVNIGDTVTMYIRSVNANESRQDPTATGHGIEIAGAPYEVTEGALPQDNLAWGTWYTVTFRVTKQSTFLYFCTQPCSQKHGEMNGSFAVGCGG